MQVLFERSIKTGKLPSEWCRARVSPISKKGDKSSPATYRPISLTCILCKVLEHIMASYLVKHLNKHVRSPTWLQRRKKSHVKHSLPCCLRNLQGIQVQASKLILYYWTSRRPLTRLTTQSSHGSSISMGPEELYFLDPSISWQPVTDRSS